MKSMVKIGDTVADIREGLNAGMWSVAVTRSSSELGLSAAEVENVQAEELQGRLQTIAAKFFKAGAHYVVDDIGQCAAVIHEIDERMSAGEKPCPCCNAAGAESTSSKCLLKEN